MRQALAVLTALLLLPLGLLAALPLLLPLETIHEQVENQLTAALGRPVTVSELDFQWYPNPHLYTEYVTVHGDNRSALELQGLHLAARLTDALRGQLTLHRIKVGRLAARTGELLAIAGEPGSADGEALPVTINRIDVQELTLNTDTDVSLGPYQLRLELGSGVLDSARLTRVDGRLHLDAVAGDNGWEVTVRAQNWTLPVQPALEFRSLDVRAFVDQSHIRVRQLTAEGYGGELGGTVAVDWSEGWTAQGQLSIASVELERLSPLLAAQPLTGRLDAKGQFLLTGSRFDELVLQPHVESEFVVANGAFHSEDISEPKKAGAATRFERFSGTLVLDQRHPRKIILRDLQLRTNPNWTLGPYDLHLELDEQRELAALVLFEPDKSMQLELVHDQERFRLLLRASHWTPPGGSGLRFDTLAAMGHWRDSRIHLEQVAARAFGGSAVGSASLAWGSRWVLAGQLRLSNLDLEKTLTALDATTMAGLFFGNVHFSASASDPGKLLEKPNIESDFVIIDGIVYKADLEGAIKMRQHGSRPNKGTHFNELSGNLKMNGDRIRLSDLTLLSSKLKAQGNIDVEADDALYGELDVGLNGTRGLVSVPLHVRGTVSDPAIRPTSEAIAGAAAGTIVLGPGLGTALGVKAGQVTGKLGALIKKIGRGRKTQESQVP
jgi:hypothetical protein